VDVGSLFYIILEGSVILKVPSLFEAELTAEDLLVFMLENESEIDWDTI
jgi:hypothetical protein